MAASVPVVDGAMIYIIAICALLFFLIVFFLIYFTVRFRRSRNPEPSEIRGSVLLELSWIIVPTLIALTMFVYGLTGFKFLRMAPKGSMTVKVHARQWSWVFEYDDGRKSPDLIVPLGRNVRCELIAEDVIHGFYIPAYRIQQDAVPGIRTEVWFNASSPGSAYILCSQYCGKQHSAMMAKLIAVPASQFDAWRAGSNVRFTGTDAASRMPRGQSLLFERGCISCHSVDGAVMVGPTLKGVFGATVTVKSGGVRKTVTADETYIRRSIVEPGSDIVEGFPNTMPPGMDVLSDAEINDIISYLKTLR
ncbi:MAG: cytochrome c oxidase subunit II [Spirochaetes bacterium]|nr:cytochrome c oxidase subunit II [Spirochaetota bacterium]